MNHIFTKLEEKGIRLKNHSLGNQKIKCPQCQPHSHNIKDNPLSVTINIDSVVWKCHHCEWSGGLSDKPFNKTFQVNQQKKYQKPKLPTNKPNQSLFDFFSKRKITKDTLEFFKIILDEQNFICFQYFDKDNTLTNIKYRSFNKNFKQSKDSKPTLYNYNNVHNQETVVFVEGEIDVLSCHEVGYFATTLSTGAPQNANFNKNDARFKALEFCPLQAKKIILFTDSDKSGVALHKELLHRFGKDICWYVILPNDCKDANEVLMEYGKDKLTEILNNARPYPVDGLYEASNYFNQVIDLYNGNYVRPFEIGISGLDDIYKIMTGTFHTITGIPNHGKSVFLDQILLNMAKNHSWKFAIFSPEHSTAMHMRRLVQMHTQKSFDDGFTSRMTKEELVTAMNFIQNHFYFIETRGAVPNIELILKIAKSSVLKFGVNGLVIDPYNEVNAKRSGNTREDEHIRDFISLCKRFARLHDLVCWVVAHPTKLPKTENGAYSPPTAYDISGAAHWHNQADAVLTVHRDFNENITRVITRKIREQELYGKIGEAQFFYDNNKRCFIPQKLETPKSNTDSSKYFQNREWEWEKKYE